MWGELGDGMEHDVVGISTLVAEEKMRRQILQMVKDTVVEAGQNLLLLTDDNGAFRDKLAVWLRALDGGEKKVEG